MNGSQPPATSASHKTKRKRIKRKACVHCRKSHSSCDEERPCWRCKSKGLQCIEDDDDVAAAATAATAPSPIENDSNQHGESKRKRARTSAASSAAAAAASTIDFADLFSEQPLSSDMDLSFLQNTTPSPTAMDAQSQSSGTSQASGDAWGVLAELLQGSLASPIPPPSDTATAAVAQDAIPQQQALQLAVPLPQPVATTTQQATAAADIAGNMEQRVHQLESQLGAITSVLANVLANQQQAQQQQQKNADAAVLKILTQQRKDERGNVLAVTAWDKRTWNLVYANDIISSWFLDLRRAIPEGKPDVLSSRQAIRITDLTHPSALPYFIDLLMILTTPRDKTIILKNRHYIVYPNSQLKLDVICSIYVLPELSFFFVEHRKTSPEERSQSFDFWKANNHLIEVLTPDDINSLLRPRRLDNYGVVQDAMDPAISTQQDFGQEGQAASQRLHKQR